MASACEEIGVYNTKMKDCRGNLRFYYHLSDSGPDHLQPPTRYDPD